MKVSANLTRPIDYNDPFVEHLYQDIGALIVDQSGDVDDIESRLLTLSNANSVSVRTYREHNDSLGIPDSAFRGISLFHFRDTTPVQRFSTSGTSKRGRGYADYSDRGLDLMRQSIVTKARKYVFKVLDKPAVFRIVPEYQAAQGVIMAWGMQLLSEEFGDPCNSACVVDRTGVNFSRLEQGLNRAIAAQQPIVLIGGSFSYVTLCEELAKRKCRFELPTGSCVLDAGGYKGRSRVLKADEFRRMLCTTFTISESQCINLFGMTELASQLYDSATTELGPSGERPKRGDLSTRVWVRDVWDWHQVNKGSGLVEIADLCIIDRPHLLFTGDWGISSDEGVAIIGRARDTEMRGCTLSFEEVSLS